MEMKFYSTIGSYDVARALASSTIDFLLKVFTSSIIPSRNAKLSYHTHKINLVLQTMLHVYDPKIVGDKVIVF